MILALGIGVLCATGELAAAPPRACAVFDLDNTLTDARYRTLAAAHRFGREQQGKLPGAARLGRLRLADVGWDAQQTARKIGLDARTSKSFERYWSDFFWRGRSLRHDRPISKTVRLAKRAAAAGLDVVYLTGRYQGLKQSSIAQLTRLGLPNVGPSTVLTKPRIDLDTNRFKSHALRMLRRRGRPVAWYVTDSASELRALRTSLPWLKTMLVDFPVKRDGAPDAPPGTPTISIAR